jgi:D-alanine--poly(phosphoribitol) ligase subunit 1
MDLIGRIDRWSELHPRRAAHICGADLLTYAELARQSNILADYLGRSLVADGSPVAILGHKENEMLVGFLGCIKSGHPYIPLDTSLPTQRVETVVATARSSLLLTAEQIKEIVGKAKEPKGFKITKPELNDPWYIIFTSGSTGNPKGVTITRGCLENFVEWILGEQGFEEAKEVFLNQAPFSFDLSVMDLYASLASAGTLFSITKDEIAEQKNLYKSLLRSDVSVWVSTPSFARMCLMEPTFNRNMLPKVHKFWFCGETLAPDVAENLLKRFPNAEVWNTYGPTEATVATTSIQITEAVIANHSPLPVGRPKPGTQVIIHDEHAKPIPGEGRGEIIIAGPNVSIGYIHRPDLTSRAFFELNDQRAYHTGDWGHYQDGLLFFDGRMDFQIKLHGYRIEIGDIESNLHALPNVQDAVIIPVMNNERADYLVAFMILKSNIESSDFEMMREMKRQLSERVPDYMVPRKFVFLPEFPTTPNGKVDRKKLAETIQ